jgi:RNA polymerase sigma factor (sigma-70 family)
VAATRDPQAVGRHDEEKLRRFLAARRAGDETQARRWWEELVTDNFDRVKGMVLVESRGRLSADEQQEALQRALIKLANKMILTFHGTTMGEWVLSTRKLVHYACIDTQRRAATISKHERSFDHRSRDPDDPQGWDAELYAATEDQRHAQESVEDDAEALQEDVKFLDWAIARLSPKHREVIELDRDGVPVEEMQTRLGASRDAIYQRRSRSIRELGKLREDYHS